MNLFQLFFKGREPGKARVGAFVILGFVLLSALTVACRSGDGNGEDGERSGNDGDTILEGTLVAGTSGVSGSSSNTLNEPTGLVFGADRTLYITDTGNAKIRTVAPGSSVITDYAGVGDIGPDTRDGRRLGEASFFLPMNLCFAPNGDLYVTEGYYIRKIKGDQVLTVAGAGALTAAGEDGTQGSALSITIAPFSLAFFNGELHVSSMFGFIRQFSSDNLTIIAGDGTQMSTGDGGQAINAKLKFPGGMAVGPDGSLYFTEGPEGSFYFAETSPKPGSDGNRVRKINTAGVISTVPGTDTAGLHTPIGVAVSSDGTVYISDYNTHRIVRVRNGISTVIAGSAQGSGNKQLDRPRGIVIGPDGDLYVADTRNHRIMKYNIN
jgi:sugar lactone lactonase YvrE